MSRRQLLYGPFVCTSALLTYFTAALTLHGVRSTAPRILKAAALTSSNFTVMAGLSLSGASLCKSAKSADREPDASVWFTDMFGRLYVAYKRSRISEYALIRITDPNELKQRLRTEWAMQLQDHVVISAAIRQWRRPSQLEIDWLSKA